MRIKRLIVGSTNPGKVKEWKFLLKAFPLISIGELGQFPEAKENGKTFAQIAKQKARHYASLSHEFVLAEDGGFEIDFLDGAPGIKSRRILPGDKDGSDQDLVDFVMKKMQGVAQPERGARLAVCLALSNPLGEIIYEDYGEIRGIIPEVASSHLEPGYPYRSCLFIPELSKYYVELTEAEHKKYNHRANIARRLTKFLLKYT